MQSGGGDPTASPVLRPGARTGLLSIALIGGALGLLSLTDLGLQPADGRHLDWWAIAIISIVVEMMAFAR